MNSQSLFTVPARRPRRRALTPCATACLALLGCLGRPASAQGLDENWTVTIGPEVLQAEPNGSFKLANLVAADLFGPGGPGTAPDGLSDESFRALAIRTGGGPVEYAFSEPFQIAADATFFIEDLTFTPLPPPLPESISLEITPALLTGAGETTQAVVTAVLPDGSLQDVTPQVAWTSYRTSNPDIATVDESGVVTALSSGIAFITARNDGAVSSVQVTVALGDPLTTVSGFVLLEDGSPVGGAQVSVLGQGASVSSLSDGSFGIPGVLTSGGPIQVEVVADVAGQSLKASSDPIEPAPGGLTDAGLLVPTFTPPPVAAFVHDNNRQGANSVTAYDVLADGGLVAQPDVPIDSLGDGANNTTGHTAHLSPDKAFLYTTNMGSHDVSAFAVQPDNTLALLVGSPYPSGGEQPIGIEVSSSGMVYVANRETTDVGILRIEADGSLSQAFPPVPVSPGSSTAGSIKGPNSLRLNRAEDLLFVGHQFGCCGIDVLRVEPDGNLTLIGGSPLNPGLVQNLLVSPDDTRLYGASNGKSIEAFAIDPAGAIAPVPGSPFSVPGFPFNGSIQDIAMSPDGRFLYILIHTFPQEGTIKILEIEPADAGLSPIPGASTVPTGGQFPSVMTISADGEWLYAINAFSETKSIVAFDLRDDGSLIQVGAPTVVPGAGFWHFPNGLVLLE